MPLYLSGLVAICYGAHTVDPVTGVLAPVVGARLDTSSKTIVPVTSFYWLMVAEQTDSVQVGMLLKDMFPLMPKTQETFNMNTHV